MTLCPKNVSQNKQANLSVSKLIIFNFTGQKWTVMDKSVAQLAHTFKIAPRKTLSSHDRV